MKSPGIINGFSKLSREEKLEVIADLFDDPKAIMSELRSYWHGDPVKQRLFEEFSENTLSNFYLPFGVAPNFLINGISYIVPMVIEESSVIAAASSSAKFWADRGGFHSTIVSTTKVGQVHFIWEGDFRKLLNFLPVIRQELINGTRHLTSNMEKRGGGITDIELLNLTHELENYYQLKVSFETVDSMGANFINSVLEEFARILKEYFFREPGFQDDEKNCEIIMSILSNYTPDCKVKAWVECPIKELEDKDADIAADKFAWKFQQAVKIAEVDVHRAATHNKGIFNGIDAVVMATGNDFRAIEAGGHAYAARSGKYTSLTSIKLEGGRFYYELDVPLSMGTVGGLTKLHPLASLSLDMIGEPTARELMNISACVGLANNFGAIRSLITKGIQLGHMKMHLLNILNFYRATQEEKLKAIDYFKSNKVSFTSVSHYIHNLRGASLLGLEG